MRSSTVRSAMPPEEREDSRRDEAPAHGGYTAKRYLRFYALVLGILVFFGCHNYMQELIMSLPVSSSAIATRTPHPSPHAQGFKIAVILAYLEVLGVTVCSYIELLASGEKTRKSSMTAYCLLCFFLLLSSAASNISLNYINYPTKVVFRSCKIIPTLGIATCLNNKKVYWFEYALGVLISLGMILFAAADMQSSPSFSLVGIVLVCASVVSDAFLPNFQERVFAQGSSRVEVTFYTNLLCLGAMTVSLTASGDIEVLS